VVGKIAARIGPLLGVIPDMRRDVDMSDVAGLIWKPEGERN
jgi:cell division protein FtsI (penicillin-binding protein 3)